MKGLGPSLRHIGGWSPPTRGAWIERLFVVQHPPAVYCRPPHGGRGLKVCLPVDQPAGPESPPTRGAWIESSLADGLEAGESVAPHTGGVD